MAWLARFLILTVCIGIAGVAMAGFSRGSVGGIGDGTVTYSGDNSETGIWTTTLALNSPSASWYSRLQIDAGGYSGRATIVWQLQRKTGTDSWMNVPGGSITTSVVLCGATETVYPSTDGSCAVDNHNWGLDVLGAGTYRVVATVSPRS